jgi:hypothetical protein
LLWHPGELRQEGVLSCFRTQSVKSIRVGRVGRKRRSVFALRGGSSDSGPSPPLPVEHIHDVRSVSLFSHVFMSKPQLTNCQWSQWCIDAAGRGVCSSGPRQRSLAGTYLSKRKQTREGKRTRAFQSCCGSPGVDAIGNIRRVSRCGRPNPPRDKAKIASIFQAQFQNLTNFYAQCLMWP